MLIVTKIGMSKAGLIISHTPFLLFLLLTTYLSRWGALFSSVSYKMEPSSVFR